MNKDMNIDETLAVLSSDVKKLIKYFKLDRRNGGDGEALPDPDNALLESISTTITGLSARKFFTQEQVEQLKVIATEVSDLSDQRQDANYIELKSLLEEMTEKLDEQQGVLQESTVRHKHDFSVDFKNSKAALTMTVMALIIVTSLGFNINQASRNSDLRDSDIKYRYVKMQREISAKELYRLESIFDYNRNADSIKTIRREVETFERLLKEYNERQYRIRQDEARAREIEREADKLKGNK